MATPSRRPRAAAAARSAAADDGTPVRTGQCMVNDNTRFSGGNGGRANQRGGSPGRGGTASQSERRTGRPRGCRSPGTAGGGGGDWSTPPQPHYNRAMSAPEGGWPPPRRKARTCRDSPLIGNTCNYRNYMETYLTTTTGCNWQGGSQTNPSGKVIGAG